jgi:hypothetical protein
VRDSVFKVHGTRKRHTSLLLDETGDYAEERTRLTTHAGSWQQERLGHGSLNAQRAKVPRMAADTI